MRHRAFTLVELLTICAIIAVLLAILGPSLGRATAYSRLAVCASSQHQIGLSLTAYVGDTFGKLPPVNNTTNSLTTNHWPYWFLEGNINNPWNLGYLWMHGSLREHRILFCPSDTSIAAYSTPKFPQMVGTPPATAYGIRISHNFNPMTVSVSNRARKYTSLANLETDGVLIYDWLWSTTGMHPGLDANNVLRGDQSVNAVYDASLNTAYTTAGVFTNNYTLYDRYIEKLLGRKWY